MLEQLTTIVHDAGELILNREFSSVSEKEGHANFVTDMDVAVQRFLISRLAELAPQADVIGEEKENGALTDSPSWVIDPIDGTSNYIHDFHCSAISVALLEKREPVLGCVYNPFTGEMFSAEKGKGAFLNGKPICVSDRQLDKALVGFGTAPYNRELHEKTFRAAAVLLEEAVDVRRSGSAAMDLAYVACGRLDAYFELILSPWDLAAGALLVREAGGIFTMPFLDKPRFDVKGAVVASNPQCLERVLQVVKE